MYSGTNDFAIESIVSSTYNATQADYLMNSAKNVLPTEEYNRIINILAFSKSISKSITADTLQYMILDILSKYSFQLEKEFELFFAFARDSVLVNSFSFSEK